MGLELQCSAEKYINPLLFWKYLYLVADGSEIHGTWLAVLHRVSQLQTHRSQVQYGMNISANPAAALHHCSAWSSLRPPVLLLRADTEAWSQMPRLEDRNSSCLVKPSAQASHPWDHQGRREDGFKINCFSFCSQWLVVVHPFSNKLPELDEFMVQVEVIILEGRWKKNNYPELGRSCFPQSIGQSSPSPLGNSGGLEEETSIPEDADHNVGTHWRHRSNSHRYFTSIPLWCGIYM